MIIKLLSTALAGSLVIGSIALPAAAGDLVTNGSFTQGDFGFTSSYTDCNASSCNQATSAGAYYIGANPSMTPLSYPDWESYGDHTTGSGDMFIANGGGAGDGTPYAWQEVVDVSAGTTYTGTFWSRDVDSNNNSANLDMTVNGVAITPSSTPSQGSWGSNSGTFTALTSGPVTLQIVDNTSGFDYNDFAVDDISFASPTVSGVPEPSTWLLLIAGIGGTGLMLRSAKNSRGFRRTATCSS